MKVLAHSRSARRLAGWQNLGWRPYAPVAGTSPMGQANVNPCEDLL